MPSYRHLYWVCPYYTFDEKLCVHCEQGSRVKFKDTKTLAQYEREYCASMDGYLRCSIAQALEQEYEEKESYLEEIGKKEAGETAQAAEAGRGGSILGKPPEKGK